MKLLLILILASTSQAFMTNDQIVRKLTSEQGEVTHKKGRVLFQPLDNVLKHKKKKKAKHEQKSGRARVSASPSPTPRLESPTATPAATASATPVPTNTPTPNSTGRDLRGCDTKPKQQNTPWCTAFGLAALMENLLCDKQDLSIHHIWSLYKVYSVDAASKAVPGTKITTWDKWKEGDNKPTPDYLDFAKHKITSITEINGKTTEDDINAVKISLDSGKPVYLGLSVPRDMASCFATIRPTTKITRGGHAVAVVGYQLDPRVLGGGYLIIKNSWGPDCGDAGYQYMAFSVCGLSGAYCYFYSVDKVE